MLRVIAFALQSTLTDPPASLPSLPSFTAVPRCVPGEGDDIVVCGRVDPNRYRLNAPPTRYRRDDGALPKAEVPLAGGTLGVTAAQGNVGGIATNRAMLTWKLRF